MKHCKNCGNSLHGAYCSHCGQKSHIERITFSYTYHELFHFFTHIEKGFLHTSLHMIKKPGITITNFIEGKRKQYQQPISYFLIWTTIYILFLYYLEKLFGENTVIDYKDYFGPSATTKYAISHLSFVLTIIIPFQAFYLYVLITKSKFNYFESLAAALYSTGTIILFQFLFAFIALLIHLVSDASIDLRFSDSFKVFYLLWFIIDISRLFPKKFRFLKIILFLLLSFGTFTLWRIYGYPFLVSKFL